MNSDKIQEQVNELHNNEVQQMSEAPMKKLSSLDQAKSYQLGLQINEMNEQLINTKRTQAEQAGWIDNKTSPIKVVSSAGSGMTNQSISSTFNWNSLRKLFQEDNTVLTRKGAEMLTANTNFSEEEIREWHAGLLRDNPNGKLSKGEFVAAYEQLYRSGKAKDFCKYAFATFDPDNTGTIEFYEFMLAIGLTQSNDLDLRFALAFDMHNYDYTETMDVDGLAKAISTLYDLIGETDRKGDRDPKHHAEEIIRNSEVAGNKKLTKKEFIRECKNDLVLCRLLVPDAE